MAEQFLVLYCAVIAASVVAFCAYLVWKNAAYRYFKLVVGLSMVPVITSLLAVGVGRTLSTLEVLLIVAAPLTALFVNVLASFIRFRYG